MRVEIFKDDQHQWVKPDRLQRFLEQGWQLVAEPAPKKVSNKVKVDVKVQAVADVKKADEIDFIVPLVSMPTDNQ